MQNKNLSYKFGRHNNFLQCERRYDPATNWRYNPVLYNAQSCIMHKIRSLNYRFKRKPAVIEAFQMTRARRTDNSEWPNWLNIAWNTHYLEEGSVYPTVSGTGDGTISILTLEGEMLVSFNDWIIRGVKGELYPCKPDVFRMIYDEEED